MSSNLVIVKKPEQIEEHHAFLKWVDSEIERVHPRIKSFHQCSIELQSFLQNISGLLPIVDLHPKDAGFPISTKASLKQWMTLFCSSENVLDLEFSIDAWSPDRANRQFIDQVLSEAERNGLYVISDQEILVGPALPINPKKDPNYRQELAKIKLQDQLPNLSRDFEEIIASIVSLREPLTFSFVDDVHHPGILIECSKEDYQQLYASFSKCRAPLFERLKRVRGISALLLSFQIRSRPPGAPRDGKA